MRIAIIGAGGDVGPTQPCIVAHCLHSTGNSTSRATVDIITAVSTGRDSNAAHPTTRR